MPEISLPSPAKLNLFLHINGRREDGYHELQTYFQLTDLCDDMHFTVDSGKGCTVSPSLADVATKDNLVFKAYQLFCQQTGLTIHLSVNLDKQIPMGGGLGGGSSNAATTLLALNHLTDSPLSTAELAQLGQSLGADVPVFIQGLSAFAEGIGEQLTPAEMEPIFFVIAMPKVMVSTAAIFAEERLTRDTPKLTIAPASDRSHFLHFNNDCEQTVRVLYPEVDRTIKLLEQFGRTRLTGTGACCFCEFSSREQALKANDIIAQSVPTVIAQSLNRSPTRVALDALSMV